MPITTDFKTFANSYHKNTGNKYRPKLPNQLIMDIIKMATEQKRVDDARANLEYWKGMGNIQSTHNNTVIVDRMNLNNALKLVFNPIMDGDIEWFENGLQSIDINPYTDEIDIYTDMFDLLKENWLGVMVNNPFLPFE
tara:strand:+ start:17 stop:430 length:414 start_codon:yes stop_codon:yes gene_type:complete